ncbi:hypothetical protein LEN26_020267 [Aphanomyces euteiches]|nr:hypothetical protein LEN26_020267 [Aphanomyces euteiches]KAH9105597.1 hypothetical protein AeMF1_018642 [Aphanomyces euteiches]KAH9181827.1 hypothetical protein AeNC1_016196 [Aphanomyces euteiches]
MVGTQTNVEPRLAFDLPPHSRDTFKPTAVVVCLSLELWYASEVNSLPSSQMEYSTGAVRSGLVFKKDTKRGWFGRGNWKLRNAVLTPQELCYYTARGNKLKGHVDLTTLRLQDIEIMPPDVRKKGRSKAGIWRIAIRLTPDHRFILATGSEVDMNAWIKAFEGIIMGRQGPRSSLDSRASFLRDSFVRSSQRESFRVYRISSRELPSPIECDDDV